MQLKRTRTIALLFAIAMLPVALASCGGGGEVYGAAMSSAEATPVVDVLSNPTAYDGEKVKLEGVIGNECPTGCWFELKDGGSSIHVDIAPHGLAIPQKQGSDVTVEGVVKVTDSRLMLIGEGVEIR
jgi:hypothetical protein